MLYESREAADPFDANGPPRVTLEKLRALQPFAATPELRKIDLNTLAKSPANLRIIGDEIRRQAADGLAHSGRTIPLQYLDPSGRRVTERLGDINEFIGEFRSEPVHLKLRRQSEVNKLNSREQIVHLKPGERIEVIPAGRGNDR